MFDVIVIGMGASGLFALANIDKKKKALGIEGKKIAGSKLRISGGGRCNLTNTDEIKKLVNSYTNPSFVRPILHAFNNFKTMEYFESRGLALMNENTRIFPKSEKAQDVIDFFLKEIHRRNHEIHFEEEVLEFYSDLDSVTVKSKVSTYTCKKLILACGGATYSQTGSNGKLLKKHFDIAPFRPCLSSMSIEERSFDKLRGISIEASLKYKKLSLSGSVLFGGTFLSGPLIMDLSNYIDVGEDFVVDFAPKIRGEEIRERIKRAVKHSPKKLLKNVCPEILQLPQSFVDCVLAERNLTDVDLANARAGDVNKLIERIKSAKLRVKSKLPLEKAIVSKGGVKVDEVDNKTMSLKKDSKIMVIGEALEPVGACGGYNLQFAFSSAHRAVENI